jgi:hypothetical protein
MNSIVKNKPEAIASGFSLHGGEFIKCMLVDCGKLRIRVLHTGDETGFDAKSQWKSAS